MEMNRGLVSAAVEVLVQGSITGQRPEGLLAKRKPLRLAGRAVADAPARAAQVRFVVMNNLFPTSLPVQRQYDLKGSTLGRTAAGRGAVLKDLDLDLRIHLEEGWHDKRAPPRPACCCPIIHACATFGCTPLHATLLLPCDMKLPKAAAVPDSSPALPSCLRLKAALDRCTVVKRICWACCRRWVAARRLFAQLAADCALLEELRVMDYSLLLGVHSRSAEGYTSTELVTDRVRFPLAPCHHAILGCPRALALRACP